MISITYIPLIIISILIIALITTNFLSIIYISKLSLFKKILTGYVNYSIDKNGKPIFKYN